MEGQSVEITFQQVVARNAAHAISQDPSEEFHCWRPNWYFSRKEIEEKSPSRKDGIDFKKETWLRSLYCSFIQDLGMKLKVPQLTIATAMMFCHRFYLHQSLAKNDWQTIATVSMFLACKVEETCRLLVDVIVVAYEILYKRDPTASQRIKQKDVYEKQKQLILIGERLLMATIGFDFDVKHPYKPLVAALKKLDKSNNDMAKVAWNFVNDWLRSTLCLQYKPHYIAAGSMYLAAKFCEVKLPSEKGKVWWLEFDVSPHQLEEVIKRMLRLLEENKAAAPQKVKEEGGGAPTLSSPESCVVNGCKASNEEEKVGECCRTSDSASSSQSVVEDGSRTDEGEVHARTEPTQRPPPAAAAAAASVSGCGGGLSSSQSVVEDGSRTDEGEVHARTEPTQPPPDAAASVSGEVHARTEPTQPPPPAAASVSGLSKIDKERIKEALRKRKYEKAANKKVVVTTMPDEDSWIVRELEGGIELGSASAPKRHKL